MKNIAVTGGSGASAPYVIRELQQQGYTVLNLDIASPQTDLCAFIRTDLTDYAGVFAALHGCDAVVHFGADPEPDFDFLSGAGRFRNNTLCTYNVFNAAAALQLKKVVWASSETVLGFPFDQIKPDYLPVDEAHIKPQNSYALSKVVCEELARHMNALYRMPIIGLRLSNIHYTDNRQAANYDAIPNYWRDPCTRKFNLWAYVDVRDAARCARLALESGITTAETFIVAAADTVMNCSNSQLVDAVFPQVPLAPGADDYCTLLSIEKAAKQLGYRPKYSWRNILGR